MTAVAKKEAPKFPLSLMGATLLVVLAAACYAVIWKICLAQTGGHFNYAIDDPYIHLAIARNFAFHGVWGVTEYASSAASSSPLWIVLLSVAMRIGGDWVYWPFLFGVVFSIAATLVVYYRFLKSGIGMPLSVLASVAVFAIAPFHILPFIGMEHSLQILLDLIFAFWLLDTMGRKSEAKDFGKAVLLTALICACRYESAFLIVVPFAVCVWRRDWRLAAGFAIGPALAIGGFGLFALAMGMPWLPNSIVLKGTVPDTFSAAWFQALYLHLRGRSLALSDLFVICVAVGLAMRLRGLRAATTSLQILVWTITVTCLMHAGLAAIGFFYRYEAYMVVLTLTVIILCVREFLKYTDPSEDRPAPKLHWLIAIGAVCLAQILLTPILWFYQLSSNLIVALYAVGLVMLVRMETGAKTVGRLARSVIGSLLPLALYFIVRDRAAQAFNEIPKASSDVYAQQYQMSHFVDRYYSRGRLAANDIGAISYYSRVHLLDLWGLASDSIRKLKVDKNWNSKTMKEQIEAFKPDLVIAYPQWFLRDRALPSSLVPVATWTIPAVTSAARKIVMFYAPSEERAVVLRKQLEEFQPSLPPLVTVLYGKEAVSHVPLL